MPATNGASGSAAHNCGAATRHHPIRHPQKLGMIRVSGRRGKLKPPALTPRQNRAFWVPPLLEADHQINGRQVVRRGQAAIWESHWQGASSPQSPYLFTAEFAIGGVV